MKKAFIAAVVGMTAAISHAENNKEDLLQLAPVIVTTTGYTNYQVQRQERPEVYNQSAHIQETAPGLKSPYIGAFTGNQVAQTVDGIKFSNSLFRTGPNQYYSWIPDSFVQQISVSDGGNIGGTINRNLGIAPSHVGASYNSSLGFTETASYKEGKFGFALSNIDFGNVKTADGRIPNSSYNQQAAMFQADWSDTQKTTFMMTHSGDLNRTDKWNGGYRSTGYQAPSIYTWDSQDYTLLKHEARFNNFKLAAAYQNFEEKITDGTKPIHSNVDSYSINGEYFLKNGFSLYSTNNLEQIMYDNGVAVSSSNPIKVDKDTWGTYKQGVRWYGDVGPLDVIASVGYKEVKAGNTRFDNPEGSLIVGKNGYFASYDRSTNTPSYFSLRQSITSGRGEQLANSGLKEEYADTFRLGYKTNGLYFDVYKKHLSDAIQTRTVSTSPYVYQPYNGGTIDVYGSTFGYKNKSVMNSKWGIDTRLEYAYGESNPPTGVTQPTNKTTPFIAYAKVNYDKAWIEYMGQTKQNRLSTDDLADVRVYGHNGGYSVFNIGYTDSYKKLDYTVTLVNAFDNGGRVLGSSVDVPARGVFLSGKYNF